ncbi:MAG TPA: BON domain-containing protein [Polyangia bacterium]|nr:BON domain-containing protein [Polyangia bacterium]
MSHAATKTPTITDRGLTSAVESSLRYDKGVSPVGVDVDTSQGIVTLSGTVHDLLAKERALRIAESIRGVLGVIDRTVVTPVSRSDEDIRKTILWSLLEDPATKAYQIGVSVKGAVATLTGTVGSYAERQLAERLAKGVKGAKDVRNDITISYFQKRTDAEIASDVKARFQWDIWLNGDALTAAVKDGKVTVSGTIGSAIGKERAADDAWVSGVMSVDDTALKVEPRTGHDARHQLKYVVKSDADIKLAIQAAFRLDPRVAAFAPDVTVEGGGVILGGSIGNLKAKAAAEQDAHNIVGVWRVDNLLTVRSKGSFVDSDLEKQLKTAVAWDPVLDRSTIDIAVINRVAYLSGEVDSRFESVEAEDVASRIDGVLLVRNHLKVEPADVFIYDDLPFFSYFDWPYYHRSSSDMYQAREPEPYLSDARIKKDIEDAFFWSPFVDRGAITVAVHGGVATLTGTVGNWIGWREADKDARKNAGDVLNRLTIKPGAWW